ncbi:TPA: hypothetical protein QCV97_005626 [Bacillus cereus]|nr:hypothetical protein [Bacillus cereus]
MWKILKILGIIVILTGCSINERPKNLISAPSSEKWLEDLKKQINKNLPMNYRLLTPVSNKDKQTIWLFDLEEGEKKEAVFMYKKPNEDCKIYLSIYHQVNGSWELMDEREFIGDKLDVLEAGDFTGNHKNEILIGISHSHEVTKSTMYALSIEKYGVKEIYKQDYTKIFVEDLNQNGIEDISLVSYQENQYLKVKFIEKFNILSETSFNSNINGIEKIQLGNVSKKNKGIVIDSGFGAHSGITYIALFTENQFKKIFTDEENPLITESLIESQDVNNDGIIDFPSTFEPKGWEDEAYSERPKFERYLQWEENDFTPIEERYVNVEKGYYVKIPKELIGKITLAPDNKKGFQCLLDVDTNEPWLEVYTFNSNENLNPKKFQKVLKNTSRIIAVPNTSNNKKWKKYIKPLTEYQQD